MNTQAKTKWEFYKELELLPDSVPAPHVTYPGFQTWLSNCWKLVMDQLFQDNQEPKIWQSVDWMGVSWWHVYNPITGQTTCFASEDEVLVWLDQYPYVS